MLGYVCEVGHETCLRDTGQWDIIFIFPDRYLQKEVVV